MSEEPKWLQRARETFAFHRKKLIECETERNWTVAQTAKSLRRSLGSVNEDITIARWLKTHENQISKFEYQFEALKFIRKQKKILELN